MNRASSDYLTYDESMTNTSKNIKKRLPIKIRFYIKTNGLGFSLSLSLSLSLISLSHLSLSIYSIYIYIYIYI